MKPPSKAWLITPQAPPESWKGYQGISPEDLIIAVDGGLKRCLELAWEPHYLCGDLDSVDEGLIASYPPGRFGASHVIKTKRIRNWPCGSVWNWASGTC